MPRDKNAPVSVPGAPDAGAAATSDGQQVNGGPADGGTQDTEAAADAQAAADAAQRRKQRGQVGESDETSAAARIAELESQLAAANAKNAELEVAANRPTVVFEPETPHGKERLQASETRNMTTAQVMAAIDEGRLPEPMNSYLCLDGYYSKRG